MPIVLPRILTPLLEPVTRMPPLSAPSTSGNALLLAPLLSLMTLVGPMMSEIPLGLKCATASSGAVSVTIPDKPLPTDAAELVAESPMRLFMMKLGRATLPAPQSMPCAALPLITLV